MNETNLVTVTAAELADCLQKTVSHLIECERALDEFHGMDADAGSGVSVVVVEAENLLHKFHANSDSLSQRLASLEQLLTQVRKTCGQNNCNCPDSDKVKKLARDLSGEQNIASGRR